MRLKVEGGLADGHCERAIFWEVFLSEISELDVGLGSGKPNVTGVGLGFRVNFRSYTTVTGRALTTPATQPDTADQGLNEKKHLRSLHPEHTAPSPTPTFGNPDSYEPL